MVRRLLKIATENRPDERDRASITLGNDTMIQVMVITSSAARDSGTPSPPRLALGDQPRATLQVDVLLPRLQQLADLPAAAPLGRAIGMNVRYRASSALPCTSLVEATGRRQFFDEGGRYCNAGTMRGIRN